MIIWRRWGILGILIPFGLAVLSQLLLGETPIYAGIGYLISALPVWLIGKKWNFSDEGIKNKHTLFWIHLEYWGILAGLLGFMIIISETIVPFATDTYFIIFGMGLIPILLYQYSKSKSSVQNILLKLSPIRIIEPKELSDQEASKVEKENTALNFEREIEKKHSPSPKNEIAEARKAIDAFKKDKILLKKFELSDHSRFVPINLEAKSTNALDSVIHTEESKESENELKEN